MRILLGTASAVALLLASTACRKSDTEGMPPAKSWEAPDENAADPEVEAPVAAAAVKSAGDEPGAGTGDNPHAGMGDNPHAGMGDNPHAGLGAGAAAGAGHGAPGSDPSRPVDESKFLAGTITASADIASRIKPGSVVFLSVHRFDPDAEGPTGSALATAKLDSATFPAKFRLTGRNAMGGGGFEGDVVISAWTDQDHDAISKQPGDVIGRVRATIPADNLELKLDTVLE